MIDITLVLHNSSVHLPKLVASLVAPGALPEGTALLVYDNASTDGSAGQIETLLAPHRAKFHDLKILRGVENLGFGRGHNAAAKEGAAEFIFVLNPDAELTPACLPTLYETARADDAKTAAWEARQAPYEHPKIYNPVTLETSWVSAAGVLLRRSAFDAAGGFDPEFFLYGEDVDLSWRLQDLGYTLRYCPRAVLLHHTYATPGEVKPMQFIGSIRANLYLRTRFGNWRAIAAGVLRQLSLLRPSRRQIPKQRRVVLKGLWLWLQHFHHWRQGSKRRIKHRFHAWEYETARLGAFYDISAGIRIANPPRVSVLIRTIGRTALLKDALACIMHQAYKNIETVIVEDGPETLREFLSPYRKEIAITYEALGGNRGRCAAGNRAMQLARGEYFLFLDDDDLLYADHIEQLVAAILQHQTKAAMSYSFELPSEYAAKEQGGGIIREGVLFSRFHAPFSFTRLLRHNYIPIHTVLFHRALFAECGGLDPAIAYNEDWNLWVRYAIHARPFATVPKTTAIYRVPMDNEAEGGRHSLMVEHQERVRKMQAELPVTLTVSELLALVESSPHEAIGLRDQIIARYPRFRRPIMLLAKISRFFG